MGFPAKATSGLPGKRVAEYRAGITAMAIKVSLRTPIQKMAAGFCKSYHRVRINPQEASCTVTALAKVGSRWNRKPAHQSTFSLGTLR
jgi:hypothetical protein